MGQAQGVAEQVDLAIVRVPASVLRDFLQQHDVGGFGGEHRDDALRVVAAVKTADALVYVP